MFGLTLRKKTPLEAVLARFTRLEGSFRKTSRALGSKRPHGMTQCLTEIRLLIADVRTEGHALEVEIRQRRRPRVSTIESLSLWADLLLGPTRSLERRLSARSGGTSRMAASVATLHRDVLALSDAVRALVMWIQTCRARLGGAAGRLEQLFRIIESLDSKTARRSSRNDLALWLDLHDVPEWEEKFQLRRLAKLYLAHAQPFQQWEVRWRSTAPGNPLRLAMVDSRFPDGQYLDELEEVIGYHDYYYIAAQLPRWHIVWKTSWTHM